MRGKAAGSRSPLTLEIKGLGARCDFCRERLPLAQGNVEQMEHGSAERLANLPTLSYEPMLAWRLDGAIEFWNAGAERLYGFRSSEAIGAVSHALLQTKVPIEFTELHSRLRNERYWCGELCHTCKDSHEVIVDSRMQLIGEDIVLEVNRDVTELRVLAMRQTMLLGELSGANPDTPAAGQDHDLL
jgi:PAS domain-containing protein